MNNINVTSHDIALVKQKEQVRYAILRIVNREFRNVCSIRGQWISGGVDIERGTVTQRSGNVTMRIAEMDVNKLVNLTSTNYVRLYQGIEDNDTMKVSWYKEGTFIVLQNGFTFDATTRTLSLTLSDMICDLNGERAGVLHAFSSIAKNSQRIDAVMKEVLELCGVTNYDITPICVTRKNVNFWDETAIEDYYVPYDLEFSVGLTGYDVLEKLVTLYSGWEMGFDVDGKFFCRRQTFEEDNSFVILDDDMLSELVISENLTKDWKQVRNYIEVWGKDGQYYGEAQDENPESPFNVAATQVVRHVDHFDQIYDRYKDVLLQDELLLQKETLEKEIAGLTTRIQKLNRQKKEDEDAGRTEEVTKCETAITKAKKDKSSKMSELTMVNNDIIANLDITGDEMAKQWAEQLLFEKCRVYDNIQLETIGLPFLNDVGCKISYRSKADNIVYTYVVTAVSHNFENNTTSITAMRFYCDQSSAYQNQLATPVITTSSVEDLTITLSVEEVEFAERYNLYIDYKLSATSTGTTLAYTLPETFEGIKTITVTASADGFRDSEHSEGITVELTGNMYITTSDGYIITTSNDENITINEGGEDNG